MNLTEIRAIARQRDIKPGTLNKTELIRTLQRQEGNNDCFNTGQAKSCGQDQCLWLGDCR